MKTCAACTKELDLGHSIGRRDVCPFCKADLRSCRNCRHSDLRAAKQCREPQAELVKDKERANFCDFFQFAERGGSGAEDGAAEQARKALDTLFRK
jgi:hypothetical protein